VGSTDDPVKLPATLIPGDGIGPEIMDAALRVLEVLDAPFEWDFRKAGKAGVEETGDPLPPATLESIRRTGLALKGPLETPVGGGYRSKRLSAAVIARPTSVCVRNSVSTRMCGRLAHSLQVAVTRTSIS
jgi:isocitrate/isopropylmalate dehydrogenase